MTTEDLNLLLFAQCHGVKIFRPAPKFDEWHAHCGAINGKPYTPLGIGKTEREAVANLRRKVMNENVSS